MRLGSIKIAAILLLGGVALTLGCGGSQVDEKSQRQSDRYYDLAVDSWYNAQDNLLAVRNLVRALDADPQNDRAHYLLGTIRLSRGELDLAEKHLRLAVSLRVKVAEASGLAEARNALGVVLIHLKQYPEAIGLLEAAAGEVLNREPWLAHGNLGWAFIEQGQYDRAIEVLRRSIFDQPKFCVGMYRLGQAYYLKQQYAEAQNALVSAVSVDEVACRSFQDAHHLLGMTYLRQSDDARAIEHFDLCIELGSSTPTGQACASARQGF